MEIKICGIKSAYEALLVASLNVNYLGVIFANSKRKVDIQTASEISQIAHKNYKKCVGVFANINEMEIFSICKNANLDIAQIYGDYTYEFKDKLNLAGVEIWKAYSLDKILPQIDKNLCDLPLFDCKGKNLGGNGTSFDWSILKGADFDFALAGGIGFYNISYAASFNPKIIDLNSKVEDENGVKSVEKISLSLKKLTL